MSIQDPFLPHQTGPMPLKKLGLTQMPNLQQRSQPPLPPIKYHKTDSIHFREAAEVDLTNHNSKSEVFESFYIIDQDLKDEITREINEAALGYRQYYLNEPKLSLRPQHDFVLKHNQLQTAALVIIQALDSGTAMHPGDTSTTFLTPQSWFHLTAAVLVAIIRGNLRSPNNIINGFKLLNTNDAFELHKDLVHPLTKGATIHHMALQIAEAYDKMHNNPYKISPRDFYKKLLTTQIDTLKKAAKTEAQATFDTTNIHKEIHEQILNDKNTMENIHNDVKNSIFQELNQEALQDLNTWREIYWEEFKEVMQQYIAINKFGIGVDQVFKKPDTKGKKHTKSNTPETQQSIEEVEKVMWIDCQAQINAMRNNTLKDMVKEMTIEINAYKQAEFTRLQAEALQSVENNIQVIKLQYRQEQEDFVRKQRDDVQLQIKEWKVHHKNVQRLDFLQKEAALLGASSWNPSWASSQQTSVEQVRTPPRISTNTLVPDPNITPTPTCVKHVQVGETDPDFKGKALPRPNLFIPESTPLPPSSPPHPNGGRRTAQQPQTTTRGQHGGTAASMHVPSRDTEVPPLTEPPIPVAEPKQPLARSTDLSAPFHVPLEYLPSRLAAPLPLVPPQAAEEGELVRLLRAIQGTITRLETRLDAQDKRIMESLEAKIEGPKPKGKQVRLADPPKTLSGKPTRTSPPPPPINRATCPSPTVILPPKWSAIVTGKSTHQQTNNKDKAKQALTETNCTSNGKPHTTATKSKSITKVTVLHGKGVSDHDLEEKIHTMLPSTIVNNVRSELEKTTTTPIVILGGWWSHNPKAHNFVYQFAGNIPFHLIHSFHKALISPLRCRTVIPNDFAQLRNVPTVNTEGVIFLSNNLLKELQQNNIFKDTIFCIPPFWQGNMNNVANKHALTIQFAYVNENGSITQKAKQEGVFMEPVLAPLVTFGPPVRATTPPRDQEDSSPMKFVAWSPARDPLDADAQAAEEAEARERLWKFHQSRALHLRAAILATQYTFPQDPPQGPED
ncbi:hypothetical protein EDB87DRAFT_1689534 [Lactarius vividus]|nr:hypothetical protein EDB87DRAFT_1689534 [Lactarius vividus]